MRIVDLEQMIVNAALERHSARSALEKLNGPGQHRSAQRKKHHRNLEIANNRLTVASQALAHLLQQTSQ